MYDYLPARRTRGHRHPPASAHHHTFNNRLSPIVELRQLSLTCTRDSGQPAAARRLARNRDGLFPAAPAPFDDCDAIVHDSRARVKGDGSLHVRFTWLAVFSLETERHEVTPGALRARIAVDQPPETRAMVGLQQVRQLMYQHVIAHERQACGPRDAKCE